MCGIVGIFSPADREKVWPEPAVATMMSRVSHRGPDGSGRHLEPGLFLGHRRLAVLDTSDAGHQPMASGDGRFIITFNGEIYNFREVRHDLEQLGHHFTSRCDTEVLLTAWSQWGDGALARLDGIFSFAIFDRPSRALYLVRDHLGVKPLFFQLRNDGVVFFASELPALFSDINPVPDENPADLDTYFTFNYLPAPRTGLTGVQQLEAGCFLRVDDHGASITRYWTPHYRSETIPWGPDTIDQFREILFRSVRNQLVADVPVGIFLSGGLDSYAVGLATVASGACPDAFTIGFAEEKFDERAEAREYADYLEIPTRQTEFRWDEEAIGQNLQAMGELLADASCFPFYQLSQFARTKATVILAGDGGDELLAGYGTYLAGDLTPLIRAVPGWVKHWCRRNAHLLSSDDQRYGRRMVLERLLDAADEGMKRDHASFRMIFGSSIKQRLYRQEFADACAATDPIGDYASRLADIPGCRSYLTARQHADLVFHLPSILAKVDRMSMAHGLEVRVPLLSKEMVEFCVNLDDRAKRTFFSGKRILKSALAGQIPPSALHRRKVGLLPPVDRWFRQGPLNRVFGDFLMTGRNRLPVLDWQAVEQFWHEHQQGKVEGGFILLGILQYINWSLKWRTP